MISQFSFARFLQVIIKFATKEIPKSPYNVQIEGAAGDASKCSARGPGIEKTGVKVNKKTYFEVITKSKPACIKHFCWDGKRKCPRRR